MPHVWNLASFVMRWVQEVYAAGFPVRPAMDCRTDTVDPRGLAALRRNSDAAGIPFCRAVMSIANFSVATTSPIRGFPPRGMRVPL